MTYRQKKEPHLHLKWGAEKFAAYRMLGYAQRLYAERTEGAAIARFGLCA